MMKKTLLEKIHGFNFQGSLTAKIGAANIVFPKSQKDISLEYPFK